MRERIPDIKMKRTLHIYVCLILGAVVQGFSMAVFLFPHSVPSGGAAGIAILMNYWFELPLGLALWLTNIFFLLFALKYFGPTWTLRTVFAVALTSTTVSVFSTHLNLPHVHLLFDLFAGSLFFGTGVGLLIRSGASSGGMVIPALMIATFKNWSPGKVLLGMNIFIFLLTAAVIDYKIVFYAMICQFLSTHIIDLMYHFKLSEGKLLIFAWRRK